MLLLAVPGIMSNRSGAPVVLFGYTKRAASAVAGTARQAGKAARQAGKGDLSGALHSLAPGGSADSASQLQVQLPASGSSSSVVAAAAQPYGSPALPVAAAAAAMAAAISAATAAAAADAAAKSAPAAAAGSAGALEVDLRGASHHGQPLLLYSLLAGALYICGVVLMALGTVRGRLGGGGRGGREENGGEERGKSRPPWMPAAPGARQLLTCPSPAHLLSRSRRSNSSKTQWRPGAR